MPLAAEHLDPETVAGFSARTLDARQRSLAFEHLAGCERCRDWITANTQISAPVQRRSPMLGWGVLAAAGVALACVAGWQLRPPARSPAPSVNSASAQSTPVFKSDDTAATAPHAITQPPRLSRQRPLPGALRQVRLAPGRTPTPAVNEISLRTTVGEKWIPASGLLEPRQPRARLDLSQRLQQAGTFRIRIVPIQPVAQLNLRIGREAVDQRR
jgi:hypothetical protein